MVGTPKQRFGLILLKQCIVNIRFRFQGKEKCETRTKLLESSQSPIYVLGKDRPALFNRCAQCTLGCTKLCVGCTTTKGFTRAHHKLVTL